MQQKIKKIRQDFPMLAQKMQGNPLLYLDSAATTYKPQCVIDAEATFYSSQYATVHRAVYDLSLQATEKYEEVRTLIKGFLNAEYREEIIFTKGTTEGINLVASSFGKAFIEEGDEILVSEMEHHSNIIPWQLLAQEKGAHLHVIPIDDKGEILLEELKKKISSKTKIVCVAHIANSTGTQNPIEEIIKIAHSFGARVLIDGAQSAPHIPIDLQKLDADFFVFSGHKIYGPTGVGVLYGKKELLDLMPPYQGGGDMVETVSFSKTTYRPLPLKFEAGTPLIAQVIALGAAMRYIQNIGLENIAAWENTLLEYATKKILEIEGLQLIGRAAIKGPILTFIIKGVHPLDLATFLSLRGIAVRSGHLCAQPTMQHFGITSATRASFAFYNTLEEIDFFIASLKEILPLLKSP